jgi:hypothetical protein
VYKKSTGWIQGKYRLNTKSTEWLQENKRVNIRTLQSKCKKNTDCIHETTERIQGKYRLNTKR